MQPTKHPLTYDDGKGGGGGGGDDRDRDRDKVKQLWTILYRVKFASTYNCLDTISVLHFQ